MVYAIELKEPNVISIFWMDGFPFPSTIGFPSESNSTRAPFKLNVPDRVNISSFISVKVSSPEPSSAASVVYGFDSSIPSMYIPIF